MLKQPMNPLLTILFSFILVACAGTAKQLYTPPATLNASAPLACHFKKQSRTQQTTHETDWYFLRNGHRTETRDVLSNQGEIWQLDNNRLFYSRIFYNEKMVIEFTPGDLNATQNTPSWEAVSTLVDTQQFGKELKLVGQETNDSGTVIEHYAKNLNASEDQLDWLPSLKLPNRIVKSQPEATITLTLVDCVNMTQLQIPNVEKVDLDSFRHVDFTDLGDMENDPQIKRIEGLLSGHHH